MEQAQARQGGEHLGGRLGQAGDLGAGDVVPGGGNLADAVAGLLELEKQIDVEGPLGDAQRGKNLVQCVAAQQLGATLGIGDGKAEEETHREVEGAGGNAADERLTGADPGTAAPAGSYDGAGIADVVNEILEGSGRGGAVGVGETNQLATSLAETDHEGAALADPARLDDAAELKIAAGVIGDDTVGAIGGAVDHDEKLDAIAIPVREIRQIRIQHPADAMLLVVSRYDNGKTHRRSVARREQKFKTSGGGRNPKIGVPLTHGLPAPRRFARDPPPPLNASRIGEIADPLRRSYSHSLSRRSSAERATIRPVESLFSDRRRAAPACSNHKNMVECVAMDKTAKRQVVFDHEKLDVYRLELELVTEVEQSLREMKTALAAKNHLWRASESMVRNIVRGTTKRTPADQAQTFDVAYGSGLECAACTDVLWAWGLLESSDAQAMKVLLDRVVAMLIGLRTVKGKQVRESRTEYTVRDQNEPAVLFAHEDLRVYQSALRFVQWCAELIQAKTVGFSRGRELDSHATGIVWRQAYKPQRALISLWRADSSPKMPYGRENSIWERSSL